MCDSMTPEQMIEESDRRIVNMQRSLEVMNYINDNRCRTSSDFVNVLLADVRCGERLDWYDRFFDDYRFQCLVVNYCACYKLGSLDYDIGLQLQSIEQEKRTYRWLMKMNAI